MIDHRNRNRKPNDHCDTEFHPSMLLLHTNEATDNVTKEFLTFNILV